MRIIVSLCAVEYTGRGEKKMNPAVRAIFIKSDGAISIHNDVGNKPLNYMGAGSVLTEENKENGTKVLNFDLAKPGDNLKIYMYDIISDTDIPLDLNREVLFHDGTEDHLQEWLADNPQALSKDYTFISREEKAGTGRVDLLMKDGKGEYIAIEVKRVATPPAVNQINGYVEMLKENPEYKNARGVVAALDIRPNTLPFAEKFGIECIKIDGELWASRKKDFKAKNNAEGMIDGDIPYDSIVMSADNYRQSLLTIERLEKEDAELKAAAKIAEKEAAKKAKEALKLATKEALKAAKLKEKSNN